MGVESDSGMPSRLVLTALLLPELQAVAALSEEKRVAPGEVGAGKEAVVELGD